MNDRIANTDESHSEPDAPITGRAPLQYREPVEVLNELASRFFGAGGQNIGEHTV
jgi:hypothetical protein